LASIVNGQDKFSRDEMDDLREKLDDFDEQCLLEKLKAEAEFNESCIYAAGRASA